VTSIASLYRQAQGSFLDLFQSLDEAQWSTPVPCTPAWSVRDVLSHVSGVTDDIVNGRTDGAATDRWTAAQVERSREADAADLIARWHDQIGRVADLLEAIGEVRPPVDCHAHEHDVRHALGLFDNQASDLIAFMTARFQRVPMGRPIAITFDDGATAEMPGDGDPIELGGLSQFEFVRSRLGRRTRDQVAAYDWSEPPGDGVLSKWFAFGPSEMPIVEAASRWG
jgi:uncharacterized protein (TIGR03083 family)